MQQISLASRLTYLLAQRFLQDSEHDKYSASLFYVSPLYPEVKPPLTTNPPSPLGLPQPGQDDLLGQLWSAVEGRPRPPLEAVWGDGGEGAVVWGWSRHVPSLQKLPTTELHKVNCISDILYISSDHSPLTLKGDILRLLLAYQDHCKESILVWFSLCPNINIHSQVWPCSI